MIGPTRATDDDRTLLDDVAASRDAKARYDSAFAAIVARYGPMVAATARRQLRDDARADDVAQAVFLILARRAHTIGDGSLGAWLHRATLLTARNAMKADARRSRHERAAIADRTDDAGHPIDGELLDRLDAALDALPSRDRDVIGLRFFESLNVGEIAARLDLSTEAAKKRLMRATDRLRKAARGDAAAAMAAIALPTNGPAIPVAATPAAKVLAKGTMTMMKQTMLAKAAVAAALVLAATGGAATLVAQQVGTPQTPIAATVPAAAGGGAKIKLTNGFEYEVIAVTSSLQPGQWWKPDGTPTTLPEFENDLSWVHANPPQDASIANFLYVVRTRTAEARPAPLADANLVPYASRGDKMGFNGTRPRGTLLPKGTTTSQDATDHYFLVDRTSFAEDVATSFEFGVAVGDWSSPVAISPTGDLAGPMYVNCLWSRPAVIDGRPTITVFTIGMRNRNIRIVAVDRDGNTHESAPVRPNIGPGRDFLRSLVRGVTPARFDDLTPEQVERYEIQEQPFDWVRFVDVALKPNAGTRPYAQDPLKDPPVVGTQTIDRVSIDNKPLEEALAEIAALTNLRLDAPHWPSLQESPTAPGPRSPVTLNLTNVTAPTAMRAACESAGLRDFTLVVSPDGEAIRLFHGSDRQTYGNFGTLPPPPLREH